MPDDKTFGTAGPEQPVSRADFERAVRYLNAGNVDLRDTLLKLAAQVVALTDELVRRIDRVEPQPAPPSTPAREASGTVEEAVLEAVPETLAKIQAADERSTPRVWLETDLDDKYSVTGPPIPCAELLHLCRARCCTLQFALSTADLDEGVIRWDYGQPYVIRQRASDGQCVHNDPDTRACTVHAQRPLTCRKYDCRDDKRVWTDYERRIVAPLPLRVEPPATFDLIERVKQRALAVAVEDASLRAVFPEETPKSGPPPASGTRLHPRR
jgi:Fe-S-cluster containining protein